MNKIIKYLRINAHFVYGKDEISKKDLIDVSNRSIDCLINLEDKTFFDKENNEWVKIPSDSIK